MEAADGVCFDEGVAEGLTGGGGGFVNAAVEVAVEDADEADFGHLSAAGPREERDVAGAGIDGALGGDVGGPGVGVDGCASKVEQADGVRGAKVEAEADLFEDEVAGGGDEGVGGESVGACVGGGAGVEPQLKSFDPVVGGTVSGFDFVDFDGLGAVVGGAFGGARRVDERSGAVGAAAVGVGGVGGPGVGGEEEAFGAVEAGGVGGAEAGGEVGVFEEELAAGGTGDGGQDVVTGVVVVFENETGEV